MLTLPARLSPTNWTWWARDSARDSFLSERQTQTEDGHAYKLVEPVAGASFAGGHIHQKPLARVDGRQQFGLHAWVIVNATTPGVSTCRAATLLLISVLFAFVQSCLLYAVYFESAFERCSDHDQCPVGEYCSPSLKVRELVKAIRYDECLRGNCPAIKELMRFGLNPGNCHDCFHAQLERVAVVAVVGTIFDEVTEGPLGDGDGDADGDGDGVAEAFAADRKSTSPNQRFVFPHVDNVWANVSFAIGPGWFGRGDDATELSGEEWMREAEYHCRRTDTLAMRCDHLVRRQKSISRQP